MAHVHAKDSNYFIEQLCTIGVCGALGGVAITMWAIPNGLFFLGPQFQAPFGEPWLSPVLWGGIAIVTFVLIRAVAVWVSVGKPIAADAHDHSHVHKQDHVHEHDHQHDHSIRAHDHDHDHEHAICDHAHHHDTVPVFADSMEHTHSHAEGHDHDHGWAPWRYVILLLPVGLYFLNLVPGDFQNHARVSTDLADSNGTVAAKGGDLIRGEFLHLARAANTPDDRKAYEGRNAQVIGQADVNTDSRRFGLIRYKISCCAADAIPLNMVIEVPDDSEGGKKFNAQALKGKWVDVTGIIQFRTRRGSEEYVTVLVVDAKDLKVLAKTPSNPFVY
jgi:hypothetical protein